MKIYPSKISENPNMKAIVERYLSEYAKKDDVQKIGIVEFEIVTPNHNPNNAWVHQLKGSFVEYLISHIMNSKNMVSELDECESIGILTPDQIKKLRVCFNIVQRNRNSFKVIKEIFLLSMCHYYKKKQNSFNTDLFDFYYNTKNPSNITSEQIFTLSQCLEVYYGAESNITVCNDNYSGEVDILAQCNSTYHVIDVKHRSKDPDFNQLLVYAALIYSIKKIKSSHIVIINPKTGNIKRYKLLASFYAKSNQMLNEIASGNTLLSPTPINTKPARIVKSKSVALFSPALQRKASIRKIAPRVKISDMSWTTWIVYKIFG